MKREEILKIAKPITPKAWQAQAIINGVTSIREIIKPQPIGKVNTNGADYGVIYDELDNAISGKNKVGDIFYVRETWGNYSADTPDSNAVYYLYKADYEENARGYWYEDEHINWCDFPKWRSPILMPKEAARFFIRVTDIRVERLQDKWEWVYDFEKVEVE